jgi:hypothetical protein
MLFGDDGEQPDPWTPGPPDPRIPGPPDPRTAGSPDRRIPGPPRIPRIPRTAGVITTQHLLAGRLRDLREEQIRERALRRGPAAP